MRRRSARARAGAQTRRHGSIPALRQVGSIALSSFGTGPHGTTFPAAVAVGSTIIVGWINNMNAGPYTVTDDQGGAYVQDLATQPNGFRGFIYRRSNVQGTPPTQIIITSTGATQFRTYAWEVTGLDAAAPLDGTQSVEQAATEVATATINTTVATDFMVTMVQASPSRGLSGGPLIDAPSVLLRLTESPPGTPYSGAVSEHCMSRLCGAAGANTNVSRWTGEGNSTATLFSAAYKAAA